MSPSTLRRLGRVVAGRAAIAGAVVALAAMFLPHPQMRTETVLRVQRDPLRAVAIGQLDDVELTAAIGAVPSDQARAARAGSDGLDRIAEVEPITGDEDAGGDEPPAGATATLGAEPEPDAPAVDLDATGTVDSVEQAAEYEPPAERAAEATSPERAVDGNLDAGEFTAIGVTFDDSTPASPVFVKVRDAHGWSDWYELHADAEEGPDPGTEGNGSVGTAPVWVRDADAYVVSLDPGDVERGAQVVTVQQDERTVASRSGVAGAASVEQPLPGSPPVRPRSAWAARPPSSQIPLASSIRFAVVHHTVSSNNYSAAEVPGILRSIQAYHMDGRGWSDIGYNFLVDRYGGIWEGRGRALEGAAIGAHAAGFNTGSVGVSNIGNYDLVAPSEAQLNATAEIISWRLAAYRVNPNAAVSVTAGEGSSRYPAGQTVSIPAVVGHGDVGATSCPGAYLRARLGQIRAQVSARVDRLSGPFGSVEQFDLADGRIRVAGWAIDPDSTAPVWILVDTAGGQFGFYADRRRDDVAAAFGGLGADRGFSADLAMPAGSSRACMYAINQGPGSDTLLGCKSVK